MAAKPVKVAFLADTADLRSSLSKAETAMDDAAATAKTAGQKMEAAFDGVGQGADGVASASSQAAGGLGDIAGALESTGLISEGTAAAMNTASAAIMGVTGVSDIANLAFEKLKLGQIGAKVATVAQTVATNAQTVAQKALNVVMKANPIGLVITAITLLVGAIILAYKKSETFREIVDQAWGAIKTATKTVFEWVKDKISDVIDAVEKVFLNFTGPGLIIQHWQTIKTRTSELWGKITATVGDAIGSYSKDGGGILGKIHSVIDAVGGMKSAITTKTAGMWDGLKESFKSAINAVIGWWNNFSLSLDIPNKIPGLPDSFTISTPNIPYLASGGIVTSPTLAVIGEAGPEAVIPLSRLNDLGSTLRIAVELTAEHLHQIERGRRVALDIAAYRAAGGAA